MAEQFLNGAKIPATGQKVGRKGMTQRVRCRRIRQIERRPHLLHFPLNDSRLKRTPARAAKERFSRLDMPWAQATIFPDGFGNHRQNRNEARLVAFSGNTQRPFLNCSDIFTLQTEGFTYSQARSVKQHHNGGVAGCDPGFLRQLAFA